MVQRTKIELVGVLKWRSCGASHTLFNKPSTVATDPATNSRGPSGHRGPKMKISRGSEEKKHTVFIPSPPPPSTRPPTLPTPSFPSTFPSTSLHPTPGSLTPCLWALSSHPSTGSNYVNTPPPPPPTPTPGLCTPTAVDWFGLAIKGIIDFVVIKRTDVGSIPCFGSGSFTLKSCFLLPFCSLVKSFHISDLRLISYQDNKIGQQIISK